MKKRFFLLTLILLIISSTGCTGSSQGSNATQDPISTPTNAGFGLEPYEFKVSDGGKVTLRGKFVLQSPMGLTPDSNDAIFLVPLEFGDSTIGSIPSFEKGTVPQAEVDERTGDFVFTNIEPGKYAIVILTKDGIQIPAKYFGGKEGLVIFDVSQDDKDKTKEIGNITF